VVSSEGLKSSTTTDNSGCIVNKEIHDEGSYPIKLWTDDIEDSALQQLKNIARLPFIYRHVAAMPDVHFGIGATVGSVIATKKAIVPAAVGVDIGCGMMALRLAGARAEHLPESLAQIRAEIEAAVPTGFERNLPAQQNEEAVAPLYEQFRWLEVKHPKVFARRKDKPAALIASQFGSLGGGNHFIELCIDESGDLWVMLHSGSRGIGNAVGTYFISQAREEMARDFLTLPDKDLAFFREGTESFADYWQALGWAQRYAAENRKEMMRRILGVLRRHLPPFLDGVVAINCHHNYAMNEWHFGEMVYVTRKGAIRARDGDLGIVPGSMGQRSYIVRGRGNPESFNSCSHGAGRVMGRKEARRRFTVADLEEQTAGVECRKDIAVLDEIPGSYKNIDEVMARQTDLVDIVHTLKQVLCVKGA
jgi:tRNA-splicing ligase RtcB (3'-phosphate/5'-hydroxy nucleic acid ligase)